MADDLDVLRQEIERKSLELEAMKKLLELKEKEQRTSNTSLLSPHSSSFVAPEKKERLNNKDILRYSRQLILPEIGVKGQIKLCNASVLIVGAGGLGCPVAQYLAAAGVGCIGIVDYDTVEISNLHRQVLHTECRVNISKAESVKIQLNKLNSSVVCIPYSKQLTSNATDNVATRYLLNDACVLARKPLVSGSALRFEGQLTVYNHDGGPCYRCLFPTPPPPESVGNCSDTGVLGPASYSQKMLIYDALDGRFLTIKLRPRQSNCCVCGDNPSINKLLDYELFCGASATDKTPSLKILHKQQRISVQASRPHYGIEESHKIDQGSGGRSRVEYKQVIDQHNPHILLDVREPVELEICSLPAESLNIPLRILHSPEQQNTLTQAISNLAEKETCLSTVNVYILCKQGNDSQKAVKLLRETMCGNTAQLSHNGDTSHQIENKQEIQDESKPCNVVFKDIAGGLHAWSKHIDKDFPVY
ncbi:Molybdenum cofactor synthesis protein 3 [Desmophyllum pertusum]|uniref:Molybdenum cofactor synthesis protein 3 n=1 Tax=Desmophyllum pertusum TaxID=174260 RepID=A0A9W9Y9Y6_9CNID|nr:Molybdenum cofactor synthesis protein 3 [Desmophyllum pertusum]